MQGEPCSDRQAYPTCRKYSVGQEKRKRIKGSSYETRLGKARSGRKWAQRCREWQSLQVRRGRMRGGATRTAGFSHLWKRLEGKAGGCDSGSGGDQVVVGGS